MKDNSLDNLFELIPETDIYSYCKKLAYQDEHVAEALLKHFKKKLPSPEVVPNQKELEKEIDRCFNHVFPSHRNYYDSGFEELDWEKVGKDLKRVIFKLQQLGDLGHETLIAELVVYALQKIDDNFEDYLFDDYDFDFDDLHAEELTGLLVTTLGSGKLSKEEQLGIANSLDKLSRSLAFDHVDFEVIVQDIRNRLLTDDERIGIFRRKFEQAREEYEQHRTAEDLWNYLLELGRRDEAVAVYQQHTDFIGLRNRYVALLEKEGRFKDALQVLNEGIAGERHVYGYKARWEADKLRIYEKMNDRPNIIKQGEKLFLESYSPKEYYSHLKKVVDPDKWSDYLRKLIKKKKFGSGYSHDLAEIYCAEGWTDELFQYLKSQPYGIFKSFCEYVKLFDGSQQTELLLRVELHFRNQLRNTLPRKEYHELTSDLITLRKTNALSAKTARKLVDEFRAAYQKRPALIDELKRFDKGEPTI